jgi:glycosyltransferase involved in cell wall biosynthesis
MNVLYDLRGAQTLHHPERGIARYVTNHVTALAERPEINGLRGLVDDRPLPPVAALVAERDGLVSPAQVTAHDLIRPPLIHHIGSLFELELTIDQILPPALRRPGVVRAVTLFDVIPLAYSDVHGGWAGRAWRHRAQLLTTADLVLCISEYTAADAIARLDLDPSRVHIIGTGVPQVRAEAHGPQPPPDLPGLEPGFLLYSGGTEHPRKNLARLLEAYARLEPELRARHQLVIAGRLAPSAREEIERAAEAAGFAERLLLPGFVSDDVLNALYASCALFVYPSEYEGFGLPIAEAMSHGAPVVGSWTTSCGEVLADKRATFEPQDVESIADAIRRALTEPELAAWLRARGPGEAARYRWETVAEKTIVAYEQGLARATPRRRRGRRTAVGFAAFSPPAMGSPSAALTLLAAAASERAEVHLSTPGTIRPRQLGFAVHSAGRLELALRGADGGLVALVDGPGAVAPAAELLRRHPGVAVLWELDGLLGPEHADALTEIVRLARRVAVGSDLDAWRLRLAADDPDLRPLVLPIPLGWVADRGRLDHQAPLETAVMLGAARAGARAGRFLPLVLAPRPPRLGPLSDAEVGRLADLAVTLRGRGERALVALLGDADPDAVERAMIRCREQGANGRLTWSRWPADAEVVAWSTSAGVMLDLAGAGPSASEAAIDHALRARRPIVTLGGVGERSLRVARLERGAGTAEVADRVLAALEAPDAVAIPHRRSPEAVAARLMEALVP